MEYLKIDLIDRYKNALAFINLDETIENWIAANNILQEYENSPYKVGDVVRILSGLNDDIIYTTKVIGFDKDGWLYLYWDCYWHAVDMDNPRRKVPDNL